MNVFFVILCILCFCILFYIVGSCKCRVSGLVVQLLFWANKWWWWWWWCVVNKTRRRSSLLSTPATVDASWLFTTSSVNCNPLTPLLLFIVQLDPTVVRQLANNLTDTACRAVRLRQQSFLIVCCYCWSVALAALLREQQTCPWSAWMTMCMNQNTCVHNNRRCAIYSRAQLIQQSTCRLLHSLCDDRETFHSATFICRWTIRIASDERRRRRAGLNVLGTNCDRVAVEQKFNTNWSGENAEFTSRIIALTAKRELCATLLMPNF